MVTQSTDSTPENETAARRPTLFDRLGPDAGRLLPLAGYSAIIFLLALPVAGKILARTRVQGAGYLLLTLASAAAITWLFRRAILFFSDAAGGSLHYATNGGTSTPYVQQFSLEQAMVMRGEVDEALASFERRITERGSSVDVRIRAAELYAREGNNPVRAAELLREARSRPELTEGQDIYVTNRLVDLLAGPLNEHGRALVELRRLIERYPGTSAASHARAALSAIKWRSPREA